MGARCARHSAQIATTVSEALRALSVCVPTALMVVPSAFAQTPAAAARLDADIPAQALKEALATFARDTGLQLVYVSGVASIRRWRAVQA